MGQPRSTDQADLQVAGVDGCRGGWVIATCAATGPSRLRVTIVPAIADTIALLRAGQLVAVGIDMPFGLSDDGDRDADRQARTLLGPRRSSLFSTPPRDVLEATDFDQAQASSRRSSGRGMSIQAFNLLPKMRELAACIGPELPPGLAEVHPETSFAVLAGAPCAHPKRTTAGHVERVALLGRAFDDGFDETMVKTTTVGNARAQRDDIADALIAAWTARRIATATARTLGDPAAFDRLGYPLTITA